MISEELGEFLHFLRLPGGEIGFLSNVVFEIEEFELSGEVPVDELVIAEANRAVGWKVVKVGIVPEERAFGPVGGGIFKNVGEATTVDFLFEFNSGHLEEGGIDVLDDDGRIGALVCWGDPGPVNDEGNAGAAFVSTDFASSEGEVLRVVSGGSVVGHEDDDGVVGDFEAVESVEHLAEGMVHAFEHGGIGFLMGFPLFLLIIGKKAAIRFEGGVNGVVGKVEVEGFLLPDRLFNRGNGFPGDGLGEVDFLSVVFFESGNVPDGVAFSPLGREIFISVIGAGTADVASGNIDIEAEVFGIGSGGILGAEVRLAGVNGAVAGVLESLWESGGLVAPRDA